MVRTRIAPSPTGDDLHIGNLYTAFFNWAYARKNNGQFIVRIEDTDRTRFVEGAEERILKTLGKFGLTPDETPQRQSERLPIYKKHAEELVEKGAAYYCFCTKERLDEVRKTQMSDKKVPKYDKHCLSLKIEDRKLRIEKGEQHVIRLNVPDNKEVTFHDEIRGDITFNTNDIDDQVLMKSDGYPTYHLAVVIDDHLMNISHVIRAEEWISSTPKHILLYEAFEWEKPVFAHIPILRNPDKSKLSKRKNPVWANWYLEEGYLPTAILNYISLMGWSHPDQKEIFSVDEFISVFDLKDIQAAGPVFDVVKLAWMNGEYIRAMDVQNLELKIKDYFGDTYSDEIIKKTIPLVQERIKTLKEYDEYCRFFIEKPTVTVGEIFKSPSQSTDIFQKIAAAIESISEWNLEIIGESMQKVAADAGMKNSEFFMMLRVAISGKKVSPPLNESMELLGKKECLERIKIVK